MFIHNLWEEDEIETISLYLPVSIYNIVDPIESPEVLIVKKTTVVIPTPILANSKRT